MKRALLPLFAVACLAGSACGKSSVGNPCTVSTDCDPGQTCLTSAPGGYCSKGCSAEGTSVDCPGGTVCASFAGALMCSAVCQQQSDCRAEYECNGLTGSSVKACRPKTK